MDPAAPEKTEQAPNQQVRKLALRGSAITLAGYGATQIVRLMANLWLADLLAPEAFGLTRIPNVVLIGVHMLSDIGIGTAIIQSKRGDEPLVIDTAFALQAMRGVYIFLTLCVLGCPLTWWYGQTDYLWMMPLVGVTALLDGLTAMALYTTNRALRLGRLSLIEFLSSFASSAVMCFVAWLTGSVASLLMGGIALGIVRLTLSHLWLDGARFRFAWDESARKEILSFGRWVFASTALTFVSMHIDTFAIGSLVPPAELGVYSIAMMLATMPREVVSQLSQRVYFPVVSRLIRETNDFEQVRRLRFSLCVLLTVPVACTVGVSLPIVEFLYDDRYQGGGALMTVLSIGTWFSILEMTYGAIALARGEPRFITYGTLAKSLLFIALVVPVFRAFGVLGVASLVSLSTLALVASLAYAASQTKVSMIGTDLVLTALVLGLGYATYQLHQVIAAHATSLVGIITLAIIAVGVPVTLLATKRVRLLS